MKHYSVLLHESIEGLKINPDGVYVDATLGYGGHSGQILKRIKKGFLFAFDQDEDALHFSQEKLKEVSQNFKLIDANFVKLKDELNKEGISLVDGIIFDLGLSSPQIDEATRGFSFQQDAKLDMRMDKRQKLTAKTVVNEYTEEELTKIFFNYGEENFSRSIARNIVKARTKEIIDTTLKLVDIIKASVPMQYYIKSSPQRQIFQAIRIEVNNELKALETALNEAIMLLKPGGRLCVITFHSLEDRIAKVIFKKYSEINPLVKGLPEIPDEFKPLIKLINRKPILPSEEEIKANPRSKSAKLRIIERL